LTASIQEIQVELILHAVLRESAGVERVALRLPAGATAASALAVVVERHPMLATHAKTVAFARGDAIIRPDSMLRDGDRIEALPPVSGG
jgi:molybdopterin converting factor small subunit